MHKINTPLLLLRRKRYQSGSLKIEVRRSGPDVWVFRWREQTSNAVEDWLKTLPLANGSKAKIREVFGAAFRHAMRYELYPFHPIASVRQARKRAEQPEILEPAEIAMVLHELVDIEPLRTAFLIAAVMGMRRGKIFGSKWAEVNLERATLHVRRSYVDGVEGPPKTESSRLPLPIPPQAVDALSAWKDESSYAAPGDWVFASDVSFGKQPLWSGTLWRRDVVLQSNAQGSLRLRRGWHTLRRSSASLLLSTGTKGAEWAWNSCGTRRRT